jgi:multidrug efflux pump subunit AcrA (membrane-fusion protein)
LERLSSGTATISAIEQVVVTAAVAGRLKAQAVDIGDHIKQGQLLVEIDAPLLVLEEKQALAGVQQARAAAREAEARVATARAGVEVAENMMRQKEAEVDAAKATVDFRQQQLTRFKQLSENGSVTQAVVVEREDQVGAARSQLSTAVAAVRTTRADLEVQKSKVAQTQAGLETARADLEAAQVTLEKAEYTRGLTRIVASMDGVVTQRSYSNGQHVQATRPLLTIQRADRVRVETKVPQQDVPLTHPGTPAELSIPALPGGRFPDLKVARIGFAVDGNGTMRVEIDVPNPDDKLRPGMFGQVTLNLGPGPAEAFRLPLTAFAGGGIQEAVYVVRDGKAHLTRVRVSTNNGNEAEVISGLKPDDLVVIDALGLKGDVVPIQMKEKPDSK